MEKIEKLKALSSAYELAKRDDGSEYRRMKVGAIEEDIKGIQFRLNEQTGTFELDYGIMSDACYLIVENCEDIDALEDAEFSDLVQDTASVYTGVRLSWLMPINEGEISDITKEYDCGISDACAIWYEQQVIEACEMLRQWILV